MRRLFLLNAAIILAIAIGFPISACRHATSSAGDENPNIPAYHPEATPATQFERDLKYVRDGHFAHVWIFSRKDGKELTREDSEVLRTNAPKVVDWVTTDQNRRVIAGSNFELDPPQLATLQKTFQVEDDSGK